MATKYAIRSKTPKEDLIKVNGVIKNIYTFVEVPQAVAESDPENGVCAIFTEQDKKVSPWVRVNLPSGTKEGLEKIKHVHPSHEDRMGNLLEVEDYVLTSMSGAGKLILCRVVGFTAKFVKLHDLHSNSLLARDPMLLIKVDKTAIVD